MHKPLDPRTVTAALKRAGFQRSIPCPAWGRACDPVTAGSARTALDNTPGFRCGKLPEGMEWHLPLSCGVVVRLYGGVDASAVLKAFAAAGFYTEVVNSPVAFIVRYPEVPRGQD